MQEKIRSVRVHKAVNSIELGLWRRMPFAQMTLLWRKEYGECVCPRMNGGVWNGCRRIEAERYRQEKSWWKCWSTGLKSCSESLRGPVTSEGCAKEAVHDHTCGISWLILLQNSILFEACPEWMEVSHRGGSCSSLTLREQRQRREFGLHWLSEGGECCLCAAVQRRCLWHACPWLCWMRLWSQNVLHEKQMECQSYQYE